MTKLPHGPSHHHCIASMTVTALLFAEVAFPCTVWRSTLLLQSHRRTLLLLLCRLRLRVFEGRLTFPARMMRFARVEEAEVIPVLLLVSSMSIHRRLNRALLRSRDLRPDEERPAAVSTSLLPPWIPRPDAVVFPGFASSSTFIVL